MAKAKSIALTDAPLGFSPLSTASAEFRQMLLQSIESEARVQLSLGMSGMDQKLELLECRVSTSSDVKSKILISTRTEPLPTEIQDTRFEAFAIFFLKQSSLLCLQSSHVIWNERGVELETPWRAFRFQRRKSPRLEIPLGYEYYAKLTTERPFQLRILDVSSDGMSLLATSRQASVLPKKTPIKKMSFEIDRYVLQTSAKVMRQAPCKLANGDEGIRIGIKFEQLGPKEEQFLSAFVARHLVQYLR